NRVLVLAAHTCTPTEGPGGSRCLAAVRIVFFHRHAQFPGIDTVDVFCHDVCVEARFAARTGAADSGTIGADAVAHIPLAPRDVWSNDRRAWCAMAAVFKKATARAPSGCDAVPVDAWLLCRVANSRRGFGLRDGMVSVFSTC